MTTLADIGEDALIERLIRLVPHAPQPGHGPGDDCAVVDPGTGDLLTLLKTDALVERVHFLSDTPAAAVGWKAAARVISDFAAMGGRPDHFLITLALSPDTAVSWAEDLYRGFARCLATCGGSVAGGETCRVPVGSPAVISIAATGHTNRHHLVLRSGARPGDALLVTGRLGGSLRGKHLNFTPRIIETAWLVSHIKPSAMMDLSDGLARDLPRLARASGCGYRLERGGLPCNAGCGVAEAMGDGEDYEMLLAMAPEQVESLMQDWVAVFPDLPLTVIGELVPMGTGDDDHSGGWDHFRSP